MVEERRKLLKLISLRAPHVNTSAYASRENDFISCYVREKLWWALSSVLYKKKQRFDSFFTLRELVDELINEEETITDISGEMYNRARYPLVSSALWDALFYYEKSPDWDILAFERNDLSILENLIAAPWNVTGIPDEAKQEILKVHYQMKEESRKQYGGDEGLFDDYNADYGAVVVICSKQLQEFLKRTEEEPAFRESPGAVEVNDILERLKSAFDAFWLVDSIGVLIGILDSDGDMEPIYEIPLELGIFGELLDDLMCQKETEKGSG